MSRNNNVTHMHGALEYTNNEYKYEKLYLDINITILK